MGRIAVQERVEMATRQHMDLRYMLAPKSIAVIGASAEPTRMSGMIVSQIRRFGFEGEVYPINPKYDELAGFRCYGSILDLRDNPPDVAVVFVNAEAAVKAAEDCAEIGVRSLIVLTAGFAETGDEGVRMQERLVEICRGAGMPACGPNTAGLANFNNGFIAFGASGFLGLKKAGRGNVGVISASGGLATTILGHCQQRGLGVSHLIGIGNEAVTTAADYLSYLIDDPQVDCVVCLLESVRDAEGFLAAADKAMEQGKTVIVMKQGRSDVGLRAIQTHTAALGGAAVDFEAACRAHGIIVVRELTALADQALLATRLKAVSGYDIGVLSLPGGGTSLLADAGREQGFELPLLSEPIKQQLRPIVPKIAAVANPLDPTAGFGRDTARLKACIETFASEPAFEIFFFFQSQAEPEYCKMIASTLVESSKVIGKPMIVVWEAGEGLEEGAWKVLREAGVPLFPSTMDAFTALARHRDHARSAARRANTTRRDFGPLQKSGFTAPSRDDFDSLDEWLRALLDAAGIPRPGSDIVQTEDEAVAAAERIGYPVAVKLVSSTITHKSDVGGVHLFLKDAAAVRAAVRAIRGNVAAADVDGILVQQMIEGGTEWLVGVHTDEQFGPLVTIGFGGILTDLIADAARRPVPVTEADVREMIGELKTAPLLKGYRGRPAGEVGLFVDLVQRVAWVAHELRATRPEFELNPVIVGPEGTTPLAVDWAGR
ncbi:pimeloyl-CoA synthetase [Agaricicola taiwanensis]|uniref:Pimeloyl-CoA synthetase n=1 Tax=Agaricicola taiwanensis TaxID=591372 RepID=A0A8J3E0T9_9RHOB|nr:acetate--CoA ligase family protein [Agaricicola taiwanensis]GGE54810.1 pimeloyl-CoA synthetase [Agaricicola taiwanensis]